MRKLLLAFGALLLTAANANATCTSPAVMHDFPGTAFNMSLATECRRWQLCIKRRSRG